MAVVKDVLRARIVGVWMGRRQKMMWRSTFVPDYPVEVQRSCESERRLVGIAAVGLLVGGLIWAEPARTAAQVIGGEPRPFSLPNPAISNAAGRVTSPTRRIIVSGSSLEENAQLAWSAEEALQRIEHLVDMSAPFTRLDPLRIMLNRSVAVESGELVRACAWVDRQLVQRISVTNPELVDQEDLLESLSRLVLARYVISLQAIEERQVEPGAVPDWLAVGVAQNLYSGLRERNAQIMLREWQNGRHFTWAEVLELDIMPDGRWGEKAAAGLAVGLLASQPDRGVFFRRLFACVVNRRTITPALFSQMDPRRRSPLEWEKEWDIWIAAQEKVVRMSRAAGAFKWDDLHRELVIKPLDLGFAEQAGMPSEFSLEELIKWRYEPWAAPLATLVAFRIRALGIGQSQTYWTVCDAYADFLESVADCRTQGWWGRRIRRSATERKLKRELEFAREMDARAGDAVSPEGGESSGQELGITAEEGGMQRFLPRAERIRWMDQVRLQHKAQQSVSPAVRVRP